MNKRLKYTLLMFLSLCLPVAAALAEEARPLPSVAWSHQTEVGTLCVRSDELDQEAWLFLPSGADLSALCLTVDEEAAYGQALCWLGANGTAVPYQAGAEIDWLSIAVESAESVFSAALVPDGAQEADAVLRVNVMKSEYLRSAHLFSADPVNEGREWLENCPLHENSTTGTLAMLRADGSLSAFERIEKLRGRGNSTWEKAINKKPYQVKLERKVNLLETGVAEEANKKWVLLSNEAVLTTDADLSMLRNQIALDLSREFGLSETSECEQVDLYYDDCYRGTYLLCEKVEVNPGRLEIVDFDDIIKRIAKGVGIGDLDALERVESTNSDGAQIFYLEGVPEPEDLTIGGYLVEMERGTFEDGTVSDPGGFKLANGEMYALKNPSYAGKRMVTYISELMQAAYVTLQNDGVHPETGALLEEIMDIDSFTKSFLIQEATQNKDAYATTSTNFVVPQGEYKLYAGPVWDFDLTTGNVEELRNNNDWSRAFYRTTVLQKAAKQLYRDELYPIIRNILLGDQPGKYLKSLSQYQRELEASWRMNDHRFFAKGFQASSTNRSLNSYVERLRDFWDKQSVWLLGEIESWTGDEPSHGVELTLTAAYCRVERSIQMKQLDEQRSNLRVVSTTSTCLKQPTEDEFGIWQAEMILKCKPNTVLADDLVIAVNGEEIAYERREDGTLRVACTFEDPSYRPAMLDGKDYGAVFDFDYFADSYPDLLEECGGDKEAALRYFVEIGMDEGMLGSEYFDPGLIAMNDARIEARFTDQWRKYYEGFLNGSIGGTERFEPELLDGSFE